MKDAKNFLAIFYAVTNYVFSKIADEQ